jgi:hypothetical protein
MTNSFLDLTRKARPTNPWRPFLKRSIQVKPTPKRTAIVSISIADIGIAMTPIEWKIIDKDGDDVLVIAKKALVYHESSIDFSGYENSSGRKFLNSDFIDAAFTAKEKEKILTTKLDNSPYFFDKDYSSLPSDPETERCCASTEDKIFLLSYAEWERLLKGKEEDRLELTDYAKSFSKDWPDQFPWWWLRTLSDVTSWYPLCVRPEFQSISPWKGDFFLYLRPAMWLRLGK